MHPVRVNLKVQAVNLVHDTANKIAKVLIPFFKDFEGKQVYTVNYKFLKSVEEIIPSVPNIDNNVWWDSYISHCSFGWTVSATLYDEKESVSERFEFYVHIGNLKHQFLDSVRDWKELRSDYTSVEILNLINQIEAAEKEVRNLKALLPFQLN